MKFRIAAVGDRMPAWITSGFEEYAKRMPSESALVLSEIRPEARRRKILDPAETKRLLDGEAVRLRACLPRRCVLIALDERGRSYSTVEFSRVVENWFREGGDVCFLIGGPDGLQEQLKQSANLVLSLSPMTLPHPLARVILVEQLYRAVSLLHNHPYHRE